MYFILIYLTEHITPKQQGFGVNSDLGGWCGYRQKVHRTEEGGNEEKNLHSLVLIKSREEVSRFIRRDRVIGH